MDSERATLLRQVEEAREQARLSEERLQEVTRAARDVLHLLSNDLTLAVGYVELLQVHPALPAEVRDLVQGASDGLETASQNIERLHAGLRPSSQPMSPTASHEPPT